jgi:hypothetical protein
MIQPKSHYIMVAMAGSPALFSYWFQPPAPPGEDPGIEVFSRQKRRSRRSGLSLTGCRSALGLIWFRGRLKPDLLSDRSGSIPEAGGDELAVFPE